ncbi:flavin reductase [Cupriavidus necator]|uniref:flavin reductase n=1 Tax=Cupriavidus necator TaxID=106590 RepID=UPI0006919556|nr:flavin reductase [Cupriavidus necator]
MNGFPFSAPPSSQHRELLDGISAQRFREALSRAATPVTVIATNGQAGEAGVTCSAVCSVCDNPPTVLVCINRNSYANAVIKANGVLSVNWLHAGQSGLSQVFAGAGGLPMPERFATGTWHRQRTGSPCSSDASLTLDCRVSEAFEVGSHSIFLARVVAAAHDETDSVPPLVYCQRSYATTTPVAA